MADENIGVRLRVLGRLGFSREMAKAEESVEDFADEAKRADTHIRTSTDSTKGWTDSLRKFNINMSAASNIMKLLKLPVFIAGARFAAGALTQLAGAAVALVSALAPVAGVLATLPAFLSASGLAMATLALGGKDLANVLKKQLEPTLGDLQKIVAQRLTPALSANLDKLLTTFGPLARRTIGAVSDELAKLSTRATSMLQRPGTKGDVSDFLGLSTDLIRTGGRSVLHLADAFRAVVMAAMPLTRWLSRMGLELSKNIEHFFESQRASDGLATFFDMVKERLKLVGRLLSNFGRIFSVIFTESMPAGEKILRFFVRQIGQLAKWFEENRKEVRAWFNETVPVFKQAFKLIGAVIAGFFSIGKGVDSAGLFKSLRKDLLPAIVELGKSGTDQLVKDIIGLATAAADLMKVAGESGVLRAFVRGLTGVMNVFRWILNHVPGAGGVAGTFASFVGIVGAIPVLKLKHFVTLFKTGLPNLLKWITKTDSLGAALKVLGGGFMRIAKGAIPFLMRAVMGLFTLIMAHPFVAIAVAIGILVFFIIKNWDKIWPVVKRVWNWIQDKVGAVAKWIGDRISTLVGWIVNLWQNTRDKTINIWNGVLDWFRNLPSKIKNFFANAGQWLIDAGRRVIGGFINGLQGAVKKVPSSLMSAFKGAAGAFLPGAGLLADQLGDGFGIAGPGGGGSAVAMANKAITAVPGYQTITNSYRSPARNAAVGGAENSYHMDTNNPAADIGGENLRAIYSYLSRFPHRELIDEGDHIHVADQGAVVRGPATVKIGNISEALSFTPLTGSGAKNKGTAVNNFYFNISGVNDPTRIGRALEKYVSDRLARQ